MAWVVIGRMVFFVVSGAVVGKGEPVFLWALTHAVMARQSLLVFVAKVRGPQWSFLMCARSAIVVHVSLGHRGAPLTPKMQVIASSMCGVAHPLTGKPWSEGAGRRRFGRGRGLRCVQGIRTAG